MSDSDSNIKGLANDRQLPTPYTQNVHMPARLDRYGGVITAPPSHQLSLEGSYYTAFNATDDLATTLAGHTAAVLADSDVTLTKPFIGLRMADASSKYAFLSWIEITVITAAAAGTQACWAAQTDSGTTRMSGGTALTRVSPNQRSSNTPDLTCTGGVITATAETAACRVIGFGTVRPSIEIAGDRKIFLFGTEVGAASSTDAAAGSIRTSVVVLPPVVLGATDSFLLALHGQASQSAAGIYKVRMGWWER